MSNESASMSSLLDPGLIVALVAIWFTWQQFRRGNQVVLRILVCAYSLQQSAENATVPFEFLMVRMRNHGIALHSVQMALSFSGPHGMGRLSVPLKRFGPSVGGNDRFEKGMVGEFGLKSYELDDTGRGMLLFLRDIDGQAVSLCVYSEGYLAKAFRVGGVGERVKTRWNQLSAKINGLFDHEIAKNEHGVPIIKTRHLVPTFTILSDNVAGFVESLRDKEVAE